MEPAVVMRPRMCTRSLIAIGRPCSGPHTRPGGALLIGPLRRAERVVAIDVDEGMQARIERGDAVEAGRHDFRDDTTPLARCCASSDNDSEVRLVVTSSESGGVGQVRFLAG